MGPKSALDDKSSKKDPGNSDSDEDESKPLKKRKSGIMAKPDEADILKTVRYPHELLDDRHVLGPDKVFNKLSFLQLLCRGVGTYQEGRYFSSREGTPG